MTDTVFIIKIESNQHRHPCLRRGRLCGSRNPGFRHIGSRCEVIPTTPLDSGLRRNDRLGVVYSHGNAGSDRFRSSLTHQ